MMKPALNPTKSAAAPMMAAVIMSSTTHTSGKDE
jgi:hypothetical protein